MTCGIMRAHPINSAGLIRREWCESARVLSLRRG
jgi:hypothetical protein